MQTSWSGGTQKTGSIGAEGHWWMIARETYKYVMSRLYVMCSRSFSSLWLQALQEAPGRRLALALPVDLVGQMGKHFELRSGTPLLDV